MKASDLGLSLIFKVEHARFWLRIEIQIYFVVEHGFRKKVSCFYLRNFQNIPFRLKHCRLPQLNLRPNSIVDPETFHIIRQRLLAN